MTSTSVKIVRTVKDLRAQVKKWQRQDLKVGLIPTMGALHHGHLSIIKQIQHQVDRTVVSIFVNPKQFGPNEDFSTYPRQEADDLAQLQTVGTDLLYAPEVGEIYPEGFLTNVSIKELTSILCGAKRPGHFDGVTTIVSKLLLQCLPDVAIFGEKDFQQYVVLKQLVKDLDIPTEVIGGNLVRDEDGLATSSRNIYLSPEERQIALELNKTLTNIATILENKEMTIERALSTGMAHLLNAGFREIQYLEIRDEENLAEITEEIRRPARVLVAAMLGNTRLIDNMAIRVAGSKDYKEK